MNFSLSDLEYDVYCRIRPPDFTNNAQSEYFTL